MIFLVYLVENVYSPGIVDTITKHHGTGTCSAESVNTLQAPFRTVWKTYRYDQRAQPGFDACALAARPMPGAS